jgi:hypothetical protein
LVDRRLVSKKALAVLNRLQPYEEGHGAAGPHEHPLPLIKEIADSDKHRVLAASVVQADMKEIAFRWDTSAASSPTQELLVSPGDMDLDSGTPIIRYRFEIGNEKANVKVYRQPKPDVLFRSDNWIFKLRNVEDSLKWTYARLHNFVPLFPAR